MFRLGYIRVLSRTFHPRFIGHCGEIIEPFKSAHVTSKRIWLIAEVDVSEKKRIEKLGAGRLRRAHELKQPVSDGRSLLVFVACY